MNDIEVHVEIPEPTAEQRERRELGPVTVSTTWAKATSAEILADLQTIADAQIPPWRAPPFGAVPLHKMAANFLFGAFPPARSRRQTMRATRRARKLRRGWA